MKPIKVIRFPYRQIQVTFRFQTDHVLVEVESLGVMFFAKDVEEAWEQVKRKIDSKI